MDHDRFDNWTRTLSATSSRRQTLGALLLSALTSHVDDEAAAGPGCKNVGKKCQKKKDCCSGICTGKKGKKKCKAHDTGGCQAGQGDDYCGGATVECTTSTGEMGYCQTTTGNAGYCNADGTCFACTKDANCKAKCGPAAACVVCAGCVETGGRACVGLYQSSCGNGYV